MAKWEDYVITKVSFDKKGTIEAAYVYNDYENHLGEGELRTRDWLVSKFQNSYTFCCAIRREGGFYRLRKVTYADDRIIGAAGLPKALPKRKTFISYYHHDDQTYKEIFENLCSDLIVAKSVQKDEIDSDNSANYIKQLIHEDFMADVSVLIVLVGAKTKCRKHVDWEIYGALDHKVGDRHAGLIGFLLPDHPDYQRSHYTYANLPLRLAANAKSGYAKIYDWTTDTVALQKIIEAAFERRVEEDKIVSRLLPQMQRNICD